MFPRLTGNDFLYRAASHAEFFGQMRDIIFTILPTVSKIKDPFVRQFGFMVPLAFSDNFRLKPGPMIITSMYFFGMLCEMCVKPFSKGFVAKISMFRSGWKLFRIKTGPMPISFRRATFAVAVCGIFLRCSSKQVARIVARRVIAFVANVVRSRVLAVGKFIAYALCSQTDGFALTGNTKLPVISLRTAAPPFPTFVGTSFLNEGVEPLNFSLRKLWQNKIFHCFGYANYNIFSMSWRLLICQLAPK